MTIDVVGSNLEENMFNVGVLIKEYSHALVIGELFLFEGFIIPPIYMCISINLVAH
jgi:hypothetical protein